MGEQNNENSFGGDVHFPWWLSKVLRGVMLSAIESTIIKSHRRILAVVL